MKDQQVINKIQLLKKMHLKKSVLKNIKEDVYMQVAEKKKKQLFFGLENSFYYGVAVAMILVVFLFGSRIFFPSQLNTAILFTKITLAQNQYQKAQIAFADTKNTFSTSTNVQELSQSLLVTNTQLDNLKLKGEAGKYTAQECHIIYQEYLLFLEAKEKQLEKNTHPSSAIASQINSYEEQAEKKLHMYDSL